MKDKNEWMLCEAIYKASGEENYFMIGHYDRSYYKKIRELQHKSKLPNCCTGYYIDDVSIFECDSLGNTINIYTTSDIKESQFQILKEKTSYRLENVFFENGKSNLLPESFKELNDLCEYLKKETRYSIEIIGHTDNIGGIKYNQELSESRAKSVFEYILSMGIDIHRIKYNGMGSSQPIMSNESEEGKKHNRRVEFILKKN